MALRIRLARGGAKKRPFYRIVVADVRAPRDGKFIEKLGTYNPLVAKDSEQHLSLVEDRVKYWLDQGADPSDRVTRLLTYKNIISNYNIPKQNKKNQPKAKAMERIKALEEEKNKSADSESSPEQA